MHCGEGNELQTAEVLKLKFEGSTKICLFTYEKMKRYEGGWHSETELLFPGYVFVSYSGPGSQDEKDGFGMEVGQNGVSVSGSGSVLEGDSVLDGEAQKYLKPIGAEESRFLQELSGAGCHIPMSRGYIREGTAYITEGPLTGKEKAICKIDRHKRLARIRSPLERYRERGVWAGLEIVSKS